MKKTAISFCTHQPFNILLLRFIFNCFFFSSRRRHTRSLRDWSSDMCSSDLIACFPVGSVPSSWPLRTGTIGKEERRVGKECRSGELSYREKKKKKTKMSK